MWLTLKIGAFPVGVAEPLVVHNQASIQLTALNGHTSQRQVVRSVMWDGEDSSSAVVTATDVTKNEVKQDCGVSVERSASAQSNSERHIWKERRQDE